MMKSLRIIVEGAGQEQDLSTECRRAFSCLIRKIGVKRMPKFICGAGRSSAFDKFKYFRENGENVILLIDSEEVLAPNVSSWGFLRASGVNWKWLDDVNQKDEDCHLMVACMENWLIACSKELSIGSKNLKINATDPQVAKPESVSKDEAKRLLADVYKRAGQREYKKGKHSFVLLERVNPQTLMSTCPRAKRFFEEVIRRCS